MCIDCGQIIIDESPTSIKAGGVLLHTLHVTLPNYSEKMILLKIHSSTTVFAYLPVAFQSDLNGT